MNTTLPTTDLDEVVDLTCRLIAIDSVNPALVSGGAGEAQIATAVCEWLTDRGFTCRRLEATPGRPSVLATASGTGGGSSLMLNGHLDTVSLASYHGDGLQPTVHDGRLHGRGAYDMKSGLAAMMVAAARAHQSPHRGDIVLALVADEEHVSLGTEEVLRHRTTDAAIVVEPTGLDLVTAHRGFVWATVTVHGRAAHGSRPDLGLDAIAKAGRFLTALDKHAEHLTARSPHPRLGTGNLHAGTITGGAEISSYPASCVITLERRTLPGEGPATFERELTDLHDNITRTDPGLAADIEITTHRPSFEAAPDSRIVTTLSKAFHTVAGRAPTRRGEAFWTDCALLDERGIDTVMFGVDGGGAHAAEEWVAIDSLQTTTTVLHHTIGQYVS